MCYGEILILCLYYVLSKLIMFYLKSFKIYICILCLIIINFLLIYRLNISSKHNISSWPLFSKQCAACVKFLHFYILVPTKFIKALRNFVIFVNMYIIIIKRKQSTKRVF